MPKTKDLRPVPIIWENRHNAYEVVAPIISEVLGINLECNSWNGISIQICLKYTKFDSLLFFPREHHWKGIEIALYFKDVDYRAVSRRLIIPPGSDLDADKLRAKWAEITALKAKDDEQRAAKKAQLQAVHSIETSLLAEVEDLGEGRFNGRFGQGWEARVTADGFNVTLQHVTPAQLRAIVKIVEGH